MSSHNKELLRIENRIAVVKEYAELWQRFFTYFSDSLAEKQITGDEEHEFNQIVSILALNQFKFAEVTRDYFKDSPQIIAVLQECVSLGHLKSLPEANFAKLQVDWHALFIGMNKTLGKLLSLLPPRRLAEMQKSPPAAAQPQ